jgi:hypothetical protein
MNVIELGRPYLGVRCEKCGRGLAFAEAPADPDEPVALPLVIEVVCDGCNHAAQYHRSKTIRFEGKQ